MSRTQTESAAKKNIQTQAELRKRQAERKRLVNWQNVEKKRDIEIGKTEKEP